MNDENCIKYKVYNGNLYDRLIQKYWQKDTPEDIKEYMNYCYLCEEYRAYGGV